jgi:3'-5' exoribonuclease
MLGMPKRVNQPIATWESGDQVQGYALLAKKEMRQDRNGNSYLDMVLADASGSIVAKVWSDAPALEGDYEAHGFVAFRGLVKSYKDQLQVAVDECRQTHDGDRQYGFDEALLIPSSPEDIDDLWARLKRIYPEEVRDPVLRRLVVETLELHGEDLRVHPAAKAMHHAYLGGLLEHTVSMAELAIPACGHYRDVNRDLVLVGILFHDLGKVLELGAMPANDYTLAGRLVGHVVIGRDLLRDRCAAIPGFPEDLQLHLEHLVLSHQGRREYGAPVEPMTLEALLLHFIDDLDSKVNQFRNQRRQSPEEVQFLRGLNRYVYLPPAPEGWDERPEAPVDVEGNEEEEEREASVLDELDREGPESPDEPVTADAGDSPRLF